MSHYRSTRRAIVRARYSEGPGKFLSLEFLVVAAFAGVAAGSWPVGIGVFLLLSIGIAFPIVALAVIGVFVLAWSALAAAIGWELGGIPGAIALGLLGLLVMGGIHLTGLGELSDAT